MGLFGKRGLGIDLRKPLSAVWMLLALLVVGSVGGLCFCSKKRWTPYAYEGFTGRNAAGESLRYMSQADRIADMKGGVISSDFYNQYNTLSDVLDGGGEVDMDSIYYLLKARKDMENYYEGSEVDRIDRIRQKITRGEYVSQDDLDEVRNSRGRSTSRHWDRERTNHYLDEYSIEDYDRRNSRVFGGPMGDELVSRSHSNTSRRLQPSRDEMRRGATLDNVFSDSFNKVQWPLDSPNMNHSFGPPADPASGYSTLETRDQKPTYDVPSPIDPYALDGISRSQIPPGEEDKYILKSKIVPPVCPACPAICPKEKGECPPCPPCERCPDPNVECKKVTKYTTKGALEGPVPILNDFSQFGM